MHIYIYILLTKAIIVLVKIYLLHLVGWIVSFKQGPMVQKLMLQHLLMASTSAFPLLTLSAPSDRN